MFASDEEVHRGRTGRRTDGRTDGCCRSIKDQRGHIYRESGRRKMSQRAGLEMLCTRDLQAEKPIAERSDGGSSERAQSPTEEADGRGGKAKHKTVVGEIQGELQISYTLLFLTARPSARIGRSQSSDCCLLKALECLRAGAVQAEVG